MPKKKTVLVIDDNLINRRILQKILLEDYEVVCCANGKEGLDLLNSLHGDVAGVMLDIIMPVMDGYVFLAEVNKIEAYKNIPIIVTTVSDQPEAELKALELGAWDFVTKPFNSQIIRFRLKNAIIRSQLSAFRQLKYLAEYDTLTGIYNKNTFFNVSEKCLKAHQECDKFSLIRMDIVGFGLINTFFGTDTGDNLLIYIAKFIEEISQKYNFLAYARMEGDVYAMFINSVDRVCIQSIIDDLTQALMRHTQNFDIVPRFGVYVFEDYETPISKAYSLANLAAKRVMQGRNSNCSYYDDALGKVITAEQTICNEMMNALKNGEFTFFLQPKYDISTDKCVGAEALVRWVHPSRGMISPGVFIPIFERNGFITQLDYYIWEGVCKLLRKWQDERKTQIPISVNVSRVNLFNPRFVESICGLVKKYNIPPNLLHIEFTESTFIENLEIMQRTVQELHDNGFVIIMDDFGSGYSSLNVLKDINFDVLKMDMRFFSKSTIEGRGENIITSVIEMTKLLNIPTVAEGVELPEQLNFLRKICCDYVQGYVYAKPMPIEQFEKIDISNEEKKYLETQSSFNNNLDNDSKVGAIFEASSQPMVTLKVEDNEYKILRVNKAFSQLLGYDSIKANYLKTSDFLDSETKQSVDNAIKMAILQRGHTNYKGICLNHKGKEFVALFDVAYVGTVGTCAIVMLRISELNGKEANLSDNPFEMNYDELLTYCSLIEENSKRDALTGAYNRTEIEKCINYALKQNPKEVALLMLDIDNFKQNNDKYGHICGDKMLQTIVKEIIKTVGDRGMVARLGGDEFVVFFNKISAHKEIVDMAYDISNGVHDVNFGDDISNVSCSIGVAFGDEDVTTFEKLYLNADSAQYIAKKSGKNSVHIFNN